MNVNAFEGKRALVTGAGQGIGRAVCLALASHGAEVYALSRTQEHLQTLSREAAGIHPIVCDLGDPEATKAALATLGVMDMLVNNAGVAQLQPFLDMETTSFSAIYKINVEAVALVSQLVARKMVDAGRGGAVVNVSSQASLIALDSHAAYCASKAALDALTRSMALELGKHKIRVNAVNPTVVMTEMGRLGWSDPAKAQPMLNRIPLGRFAELEEVVEPILFLLSPGASMITGIALPVDGGATAN